MIISRTTRKKTVWETVDHNTVTVRGRWANIRAVAKPAGPAPIIVTACSSDLDDIDDGDDDGDGD